jgi:hypothetical protein
MVQWITVNLPTIYPPKKSAYMYINTFENEQLAEKAEQ